MSYSPTIGRFLEQDPAGYIDGPNTYQFVGSNPVNRVDPTGLHLTLVGSDANKKYVRDILDDLEKNSSNDELKTLLNFIDSCDDEIKISVDDDNPYIQIGKYDTSQIDVGDIQKAPKTGPSSQASLVVHEVVEQAMKQHNHYKDTDKKNGLECHEKGMAAEALVTGWTRGDEHDSDLPDNGRQADITYKNNDDGSTVHVIVTFDGKTGGVKFHVTPPAASQPTTPAKK